MASDLSIELREYLKRCGLSDRRIARCTGNTRMYHDLGLYGDIAEGFLEELEAHYHVDLSGFTFEQYFPPEFGGRNTVISALLSIVPFAGYVARRRGEYAPLTLEMIEKVMHAKYWRALAGE